MIPDVEYLTRYFHLYNERYFYSMLPMPKIVTPKRNSLTLGKYTPPNEGGHKISVSIAYEGAEEFFQNTLLHEMIHYYLCYIGDEDNYGCHGSKFKREAKRINQDGWNIRGCATDDEMSVVRRIMYHSASPKLKGIHVMPFCGYAAYNLDSEETRCCFNMENFVDNINTQFESRSAELILHPERRMEWLAAVIRINKESYAICLDDKIDMGDAQNCVVVRSLCLLVRENTKTNHWFSAEVLDEILQKCEYLLHGFHDKFSADEERCGLYNVFAKAYRKAGATEKANNLIKQIPLWTYAEHTQVSCFNKAYSDAEKGDRDKQLYIGRCYDEGKNVHQSKHLANIWYSLSALNGNEEARNICQNKRINYKTLWWH